jgi:hypothetical protein
VNRQAGFVVSLGVAGFLVAGIGGALTACVATVIGLRWRHLIPGYAFGALVLTALLTVLERFPSSSEPLPSFVRHRQAAASLGAITGVLVLVSIVLIARAERASARPIRRPPSMPQPRPRPRPRAAVPVLVIGALGATSTGLILGSAAIAGAAAVVGCVVALAGIGAAVTGRKRRSSSAAR